MERVNIDLIGNGQSQGAVANMLLNNGKLDLGRMKPYIDSKNRVCVTVYRGGDPKLPTSYKTTVLQTNATLRREEWMRLDESVVDVARERLGGIQDLIDKNLTYNLGNAMGTTVLEWHDVGDGQEAEMSMDGISRGKGDRPNFGHNYLPIPIIHVDYEINARALAASRNMGNPLDTTAAENASRRVYEKLENLLFTDLTYAFGPKDTRNRNSIYSYVNFPDRVTMSIGTHWDDLTTDIGKTIVNKIIAAKQALLDIHFYGPFQLYIPSNYETVLDQDYNDDTSGTTSSETIRARILKIESIKGIKVIDHLTADNVLLVQMTRNVVRLVRGFGLQNVQWSEEGNMVTKFKVMTIQVPQIRSDQNGHTGILHLA
jgi:hypothetical protein